MARDKALRAAINRYLDNDGSDGRFDALELYEARKVLYALLGRPLPEERSR